MSMCAGMSWPCRLICTQHKAARALARHVPSVIICIHQRDMYTMHHVQYTHAGPSMKRGAAACFQTRCRCAQRFNTPNQKSWALYVQWKAVRGFVARTLLPPTHLSFCAPLARCAASACKLHHMRVWSEGAVGASLRVIMQ